MYLVRTIPKDESENWVHHLGEADDCWPPLPFEPRRPFKKVIVLHNGRALELEVKKIEPVNNDDPVGSKACNSIQAKVRIYFKTGKKHRKEGEALIPGFQGVRYYQNSNEVMSRNP